MVSQWQIAHASVIGNGHTREGLPCQDAHTVWQENGNFVAVVCDGAGSCKHSDLGSRMVADFALAQLQHLLLPEANLDEFDQAGWSAFVYEFVKAIQRKLSEFSDEENINYKDLSCTIIAIVATADRLLTFHVGDGRGGYQLGDGSWRAFMTPYHGEEANETVFVTSSIWESPEDYIETSIIEAQIKAVCLMSDGCEQASFQCNLYDQDLEVFYDPNVPHAPFFDPNVAALRAFHHEKKPQEEVNALWAAFLQNGNQKLSFESDDKTLVLGVRV